MAKKKKKKRYVEYLRGVFYGWYFYFILYKCNIYNLNLNIDGQIVTYIYRQYLFVFFSLHLGRFGLVYFTIIDLETKNKRAI